MLYILGNPGYLSAKLTPLYHVTLLRHMQLDQLNVVEDECILRRFLYDRVTLNNVFDIGHPWSVFGYRVARVSCSGRSRLFSKDI